MICVSDSISLDEDEMACMEIDAFDLLKGKMSEKAIRIMHDKTATK